MDANTEMAVYVKGKGYVESIGWNGITFASTPDKAFLHENIEAMKDICDCVKATFKGASVEIVTIA